MPTFDFDFQRYVERKKGAREAERREGASYAYAGDLRIRKLLDRARPVSLALEATVRLWRATARAELLGTAVKVSEQSFPRVERAAALAAERLHVTVPPVYVSPHLQLSAHTFGTDDEPQIVLHASLAETLGDAELLHVLGAELGRVQNKHVLLGTAHYFLSRSRAGFMGWIVKPAAASLASWARRAEVTADRAGLLASRDPAASLSALRALIRAVPTDGGGDADRAGSEGGDGAQGEHDGAGTSAAEGSSSRLLERRAAALAVWSRSSYYVGALGQSGGLSPTATDEETARALRGGA